MSVRENVAYAAVNDARVDDLTATLEWRTSTGTS